MKSRISVALCCLSGFCCYNALSQLPPQMVHELFAYMQPMHNTGVGALPQFAAYGDLVSDGTGHHYVIPTSGGELRHFRFYNTGVLIDSSTFADDAARPCITAREGRLHVVLENTASDEIELWRSENGGTYWEFIDFISITGELNGLDSYEDGRGIHLTYSSDAGIY